MRLAPVRRLWRACRYPLLVVALSRLVVVLLFAMEGWVTRPHGSGVGLPQMLRDLGAWDGIWYRSIAIHGYDPTIGHGDNAAFLPLYPLLLRGLRTIAPYSMPGRLMSSTYVPLPRMKRASSLRSLETPIPCSLVSRSSVVASVMFGSSVRRSVSR